MSHARETTLTFFVKYLSPLKLKACAAKIDFFSLLQVVASVAEPLLYTYQ